MRPRTRRLVFLIALSYAVTARADPQIDQAVKALQNDPSLKVRTQAALVLGQRRAREAIDALAGALEKDDAPSVRIAAATALGRIAESAAREALENAARNDRDARVRTAAARALEGFESSREGRRTVALEETQGKGSDSARSALSEALARYLSGRGFSIVPASSDARYRIKPSVVSLDVEDGDGRVIIAAKASVIAVTSDGRMEMLQGGARLKASGGNHDKLAARALEAIAKDLAEDLSAKLR